MFKYFESEKNKIVTYLEAFFQEKAKDLSRINPLGEDSLKRILEFSSNGKMIRGALVSLSYKLFSNSSDENAIKVAAAMELFQSGLLIHDDIMDKDLLRRGHKSVFAQYQVLGDKKNARDSYHLGESLGICSGDLAFFIAFEILSDLKVGAELKSKLVSMASLDLCRVSVAQMQDVLWGHINEEVKEEDLFRLYVHKTGRYTFSLPLMLGACLGGADDEVIEALGKIGEDLGVIFQIKDDELGIFSDNDSLGKTVGADILEEKKTIFYIRLLNLITEADKKKLKKIVSKNKLSVKNLEFVQDLYKETGIRENLSEENNKRAAKLSEKIKKLDIKQSEYLDYLYKLLKYNLERNF